MVGGVAEKGRDEERGEAADMFGVATMRERPKFGAIDNCCDCDWYGGRDGFGKGCGRWWGWRGGSVVCDCEPWKSCCGLCTGEGEEMKARERPPS